MNSPMNHCTCSGDARQGCVTSCSFCLALYGFVSRIWFFFSVITAVALAILSSTSSITLLPVVLNKIIYLLQGPRLTRIIDLFKLQGRVCEQAPFVHDEGVKWDVSLGWSLFLMSGCLCLIKSKGSISINCIFIF